MWNFFDGGRPPGSPEPEGRATPGEATDPGAGAETDTTPWTAWLSVAYEIATRRTGRRGGDDE